VAFDGEDDSAGHDHRDAVDAAATSKWPHREPLFGMRSKSPLHKHADSVAHSPTSPNVRSIPSVSGSDLDLHVHPVLYFVHGIGGSARTWSGQIKYFNDLGYEIIAPDLLGHGFSSAPDSSKSYTFTKLFHDLVTIFDHYVPEARHCVVVGHGYGCSLATALSRLRPNINLLVLLASGGPAPLAPPLASNRAKNDACSLLTACLKPFLKCSFSKQRKYRPQGRTSKFPQPCDVPPYVIRHVVAGQTWPEGKLSHFGLHFGAQLRFRCCFR
jgi:abhydrolase domain-containing protein 8